MGGASYDRDSFTEDGSAGSGGFSDNYDRYAAAQSRTARTAVDPLVSPEGRRLSCVDDAPDKPSTPIVVAFDVTRSRGDDVKIIFDKLPMLIGQAIGQNYVDNPKISFCAIGDATAGDKAPLQVGSFEADTTLDTIMASMWLEKGGGGTGQESYELAAYMYAYNSSLDSKVKRGEKGYFFFIGDEGFYPQVSSRQVKDIIGDDLPADLDTRDVFDALQEKYEVFYIYPKRSWQERKADIDAEIRSRVVSAGGQYDNVDLRASLLWNTRDDLDLHCICPDGVDIFYGRKIHGQGALDVDRNVNGETTKPVENIRWPSGTAPEGKYMFKVNNYAYHDNEYHQGGYRSVPFTVELECNGDIQSYNGIINRKNETVTVTTVDYDPAGREAGDDIYAGYDDQTIKAQWGEVIPADHILLIERPKAIVDVILGTLALSNGFSLDTYISHLRQRGQTDERQLEVSQSLGDMSATSALSTMVQSGSALSGTGALSSRRGGTRRL